MPQIKVITSTAIYFGGKMMYPGETYTVDDVYENYSRTAIGLEHGLIELIGTFENTTESSTTGGGGTASSVSFTPAGTLTSTNVQAALAELDTNLGNIQAVLDAINGV